MPHILRGLTLTLALLGALALAACGDDDASQRKAFITFLQTRILDKPGLRVPQLTEQERESFGPYASHYSIITDFHAGMDASVQPKMAEAISKGGFTSAADLVTRRVDLEAARDIMASMAGALTDSKARADAARQGLNQPDDLKPVYEAAYQRTVAAPASTFGGIAPVMIRVFTQALDVGSYMKEHKAVIQTSGAGVQVSDPAVLNELNRRLQDLQSSQREVLKAQQDVQRMIGG
jgi:hypothetical protein